MTLRAATIHDSDLLLAWRNDPVTVAMSMTPETVTQEDHTRWFTQILADDTRILLVAESGQTPIGSVRLDRAPTGAHEVSITVSPDHRGKGFGRALLSTANAHAFSALAARKLVASVKEDNTASQRIFEATGYRLAAIQDGVLQYHKDTDAARD